MNFSVDDAFLASRGKVSIFPRILQILQRFEDFRRLFANIPIMTQITFYPLVLYDHYSQNVQMVRTLNTGQIYDSD